MKTETLYDQSVENAYLEEIEAQVVEVQEDAVVLDKTICYPQGGGQPSDKAWLITDEQQIKVQKLKKEKGNVMHYLNADHGLSKGDKVRVKIDFDYRYKLMRHHTALHMLSAVVWDNYDAKVTGGTIQHNKARLDFDMESLNREKADKIIVELNELVGQEHPVSIDFMSRDELEAKPELIRTKVSLIPEFVKIIRTVKVGDVDYQADGGLHVRNSKEIGNVALEKFENKGKGRKRITIRVD